MTDEYPKCPKCGNGIVMPIVDYQGNLTHRCTLCGWSRTEEIGKGDASGKGN